MFGTKMRSVIKEANAAGIKKIVDQQFELGLQIAKHGLVPIIEPEVDIHSPAKAECENMLKKELKAHIDTLPKDVFIMLKLSIPTQTDLYKDFIEHPQVLRVDKGEDVACREMRKRFCAYIKGFEGSAQYRKQVVSAQTADDYREIFQALIVKTE